MSDIIVKKQSVNVANTNVPDNCIPTIIAGRRWIIPYREYNSVKIVDWEHPIWNQNPSQGQIYITAKEPLKFVSTVLVPFNDRGVRNPKKDAELPTGIRFGWTQGPVDPKAGIPKLGSYKIADGKRTTILDLSQLRERKLYVFIALNPAVSKSRNCWFEVNSVLLITDKGVAADTQRKTRKTKIEALEYIFNADDKEIRSLSRVLMKSDGADLISVLRDNIEAYVEANPDAFMDLINSRDKDYRIAFAEGKQFGILVYNVTNGHTFNGIPIGTSEHEVVSYLKQNPEIYRGIAFRLEQERLNEDGVNAEEVLYDEIPQEEESPAMKEMKAKMAEMEKKNKELQDALKSGSKNEFNDVEDIGDSISNEDNMVPGHLNYVKEKPESKTPDVGKEKKEKPKPKTSNVGREKKEKSKPKTPDVEKVNADDISDYDLCTIVQLKRYAEENYPKSEHIKLKSKKDFWDYIQSKINPGVIDAEL